MKIMPISDRTLGKLLDLRHRQEQEALKYYLSERDHLARFQEQMVLIENYRQDYIDQMHARGRAGVSTLALTSYQAFLEKLDAIIQRQRIDEEALKHRVELLNQNYLKKQQARKIIENLIEHHKKEREKLEAKREQRLNDEFGLLSMYKKSRGTR